MISLLALFWYGLVPVAGGLLSRRAWRRFRLHFDRLRLASTLDYARYIACGRAAEKPEAETARTFRFTGSFESITDGHTLWVQGPDLTIPVALAGARIYTLPLMESQGEAGDFDLLEGSLQRLRWDRVAALTGEGRVFVGGPLALREGRWIFAAAPGDPLLVIFYTGSDRSMAIRAAWAGRRRNEYWNAATPYALILGALCLITVAVTFLPRPAFRLTVIAAFTGVFVPLFPLVPPGLLFTIIYRWLWRRAQIYRACCDLARLPLVYFPAPPGKPGSLDSPVRLPGGEYYGARRRPELPGEIPVLTPGIKKPRKEPWYLFGALAVPGTAESGGSVESAAAADHRAGGHGTAGSAETLGAAGTLNSVGTVESAKNTAERAAVPMPGEAPREPEDSFAAFGAIPGNPERLVRRCIRYARLLEFLSWFLLLGGIGLNVFFIILIITLL